MPVTNLQQALMQAEFNGLSDADALAHGNATVVIGGSSDLWSYRGVVDRFGLQAGEGLLAAIQGAGLAGAALTYISPGIDLSLSVTQSQLDAIAAAVPALAGVCAALKEIGITHGTRWHGWGIAQPTLADITAARATNADLPSLDYDRREILASINIGANAIVSIRVNSAALQGGQLVQGPALATISTADADNDTLPAAQRTLLNSILTALRTYAGSL